MRRFAIALAVLFTLTTLGYSHDNDEKKHSHQPDDRPDGSTFHRHHTWADSPSDDPAKRHVFRTWSDDRCWHVHKSGNVLDGNNGHGPIHAWASDYQDSCKAEVQIATTPLVTLITPTTEIEPNAEPDIIVPGLPIEGDNEVVHIPEMVGGDIPGRIPKTEDGDTTRGILGVQPTTEMLPETVAMIAYTMTFPEGLSAAHLPIQSDITHFTTLFGALGDNVKTIAGLRPTVQHWTIVSSAKSRSDEWISAYRGFLVDMETETELTLVGPMHGYGYTMIYLKEGLNLIGVPRQSESLETIDDFYEVFRSVISVKGLEPGVEFSLPIENGWFIELDNDVEINGTTAYMIESDANAQYAVWGTQWEQPVEPSACAPGVDPLHYYKTLATTWGAIKN